MIGERGHDPSRACAVGMRDEKRVSIHVEDAEPASWARYPHHLLQGAFGIRDMRQRRDSQGDAAGGAGLQNRKRSALREEGIERVQILRGGMDTWIKPRNPD
jgi:hypothetical protein